MVELCLMCQHYLVDCTKEEVRAKLNDTYDGFKIKLETCPNYKRLEIKRGEKDE